MNNEQTLPAFIAALMQEGVTAGTIEQAVRRVRNLKLGQGIEGNLPDYGAWAWDQAKLMRDG